MLSGFVADCPSLKASAGHALGHGDLVATGARMNSIEAFERDPA
jgi:hypothetical protein